MNGQGVTGPSNDDTDPAGGRTPELLASAWVENSSWGLARASSSSKAVGLSRNEKML